MRATFAATRQYPTATYLSAILRPRKGYVLAVSYEHFYTLSAAPRQIFFPPTREKMCTGRLLHFNMSDLYFYIVLLGARGSDLYFYIVLLGTRGRGRLPSSCYRFLLLFRGSGLAFYFLLLGARGRGSLTLTLSHSRPRPLSPTLTLTQSLSTLTHTLL